MNLLVLAAETWDGTAVPCRFAVEIDGSAADVATIPVWAVDLPDGAGAVRVVATPTSAAYWSDQFHLVVTGDQVDPTVADAVKVQTTTVTAVGVVITRVTMTVSRLRDAGAAVRDLLTQPPDKRLGKPATLRNVMDHGDFPPDDWSVPDRPSTTFVNAERPVDGALIGTVTRDAVGADHEYVVVEVAGIAVPKLLAVSWPTGLLRDDGADPTPFLVYYHPSTGQNVAAGYYVGGELGPYPWNFDFAYFVLFAYLWYAVDPFLTSPYTKGIPFQVAASGKQVVSVLPCNAPVSNEFGAFTDAAAIEAILLELQALMFRRSGVRTPPATLGRTAVGAFSSGNNFMAAFLQSPKNRAHRFCLETLQEVLCFDPPGYVVSALTAAAFTWAGSPDTGRRIALYTQGGHEAHGKLLGHPPPPAPYVETTPDGTRTSALLPAAVWRATLEDLTGRPRPRWGFQETHQVIAAMMLTHAMASSGF